MGLFDKFKKKQQVKNEINNDIDKGYNEEEAIKARQSFDNFHKNNDSFIQKSICEIHKKTLDYSVESINTLMDLIKDAHEAFDRNEISAEFCELLIMAFGVYLGDTLLKNGLEETGYKWIVPEEIKNKDLRKAINYPNNKYPLLSGPSYTTPIDKVSKYWYNGDEDNLYTYWRFLNNRYNVVHWNSSYKNEKDKKEV